MGGEAGPQVRKRRVGLAFGPYSGGKSPMSSREYVGELLLLVVLVLVAIGLYLALPSLLEATPKGHLGQ